MPFIDLTPTLRHKKPPLYMVPVDVTEIFRIELWSYVHCSMDLNLGFPSKKVKFV